MTVDPTVPKMPVLSCPGFERLSERELFQGLSNNRGSDRKPGGVRGGLPREHDTVAGPTRTLVVLHSRVAACRYEESGGSELVGSIGDAVTDLVVKYGSVSDEHGACRTVVVGNGTPAEP